MCCSRYHIIFSAIFLKFRCKISVQKEVIHSFKNNILVTWPATNLLILRKWCGFEKLNHYYIFWLRYYPLMVFWRQSYNFHFHKNDFTWPLSPNGLFDILKSPVTNLHPGSYAVVNWTFIPYFCWMQSRNEDVWRCVITFGKYCLLKKIKKIFQLEGELLPRYSLLPNPTVFFYCINRIVW